MSKTRRYEIKDVRLAAEGKRRILWADGDMPVLGLIRERFSREKPLRGRRISA
jgi:adenosylhomocysteinase